MLRWFVTGAGGQLATAFASGLHSAFYGSMVLMAIAAVLSASRGRAKSLRTHSYGGAYPARAGARPVGDAPPSRAGD